MLNCLERHFLSYVWPYAHGTYILKAFLNSDQLLNDMQKKSFNNTITYFKENNKYTKNNH